MIHQLTLLRNHEVTLKMSTSAQFTKCSLPGSAENMQVYVSVCTTSEVGVQEGAHPAECGVDPGAQKRFSLD